MFVLLLICVFILIASISFLDEKKDKYVIGGYIAAGFVLFLLCAFKPIGVDEDSLLYVDYFYAPDPLLVEPLFIAISSALRELFQTPRSLFIVYALLYISVRMWAFSRITHLWYLTLLVWMSHFFIMQDLTQIRAAAATSFYLLGLSFLMDAKKGWSVPQRLPYIIIILIAANFHVSALVLLPLVFFGNEDLSPKAHKILLALPIIGYALYFLKFDPITFIPIPFIQDKIDIYEEMRDAGIAGDEINVFNILYLVKLSAYYLLLWKYKLVRPHAKFLPLFLKIYACSYFCFTAFSAMPVIAYRIGELIGVVDILLFPLLIYTVRPQWAGKAIALTYAFCVLLLNLFHNELLKFNF